MKALNLHAGCDELPSRQCKLPAHIHCQLLRRFGAMSVEPLRVGIWVGSNCASTEARAIVYGIFGGPHSSDCSLKPIVRKGLVGVER